MGERVNTGLACLAVGWGWGVADVRGALVSESTWSHFCPVSCDVMGDLYCAGRTYCYGREFEWAPDRWFCYATVVGLPLVAVLWPHGAGVPLPTVVGLGILSAAIPYSLDQVVLRMAGPSYFAILLALLPLTAALLGAVALEQSLSIAEMVGVVAVVGAVVARDHR